MPEYRCIKKLVVPELIGFEDEATGNDFVVELGEVWQKDEDRPALLYQEESGRWLDIEEDTLEEYFKRI